MFRITLMTARQREEVEKSNNNTHTLECLSIRHKAFFFALFHSFVFNEIIDQIVTQVQNKCLYIVSI